MARLPDDMDDLVDRLPAALAALNAEERRIVRLRYFDGLSLTEIGQAVRLTDKAVKMKLFRARRKLADLLGASSGSC